MTLLILSFIAGLLTVLAPCVLPLLPVIVGTSASDPRSKYKPYIITASLALSIVIFTLLLKVSTAFIDIPPETWSWISGIILIVFGVITLFPMLWERLGFVAAMNRGSNQVMGMGYQKKSIWGDIIMGAALGPVFSSCSPTYFVILATVLPQNFAAGLLDLLVYGLGLALMLLLLSVAGQKLLSKAEWASNPNGWFKRILGAIFLILGILIIVGIDKKVETYLLNNGLFDITGVEQSLLKKTQPPSVTIPTSPEMLTAMQKEARYKLAKDISTPDGFINTDNNQPINISDFKGKKVVLLDFWTYSCINCQRTIPYLNKWYEKYKDQGLEIIGLHTPEFSFEHKYENVAKAVKDLGIKYPVVLDNDYSTWFAYGNQFWPRKYLVDVDGYIVYDHIGEGNYDETEAAIVRALDELHTRMGMGDVVASSSIGADLPNNPDIQANSPETYFGAARNEYLANGKKGAQGVQQLTFPFTDLAILKGLLDKDKLYLSGSWNFTSEYAENTTADARIVFKYSAKNVYFVASADKPVAIQVLRDGVPLPDSVAGPDILLGDKNGKTTVQQEGLYKLIEDSKPGEHTLEIIIKDAGLKAFTFTFG